VTSVEPIALESYPVWDRQSSEPEEKFFLFQRYFLPLPKASLLGAFKQYKAEKGENSQINNVPGNWRDDCERYQWRDRHQAYWLKKTWDDQQWRDQKIKEHQATALDTVALLRLKAQEILENLDIDQTTAKDAAALIRLANEMAESALGYGDLDKAVNRIFASGLAVISPDDDPERVPESF
jgi:hypothetical protein